MGIRNDLKGYNKLALSTENDKSAQVFYEKLGYKVLGSFNCFNDYKELMLVREI